MKSLFLILVLAAFPIATLSQEPPIIDGVFDDWDESDVVAKDPAGDAKASDHLTLIADFQFSSKPVESDELKKKAFQAVSKALELAKGSSTDKSIKVVPNYRQITLSVPRKEFPKTIYLELFEELSRAANIELTVRHIEPKFSQSLTDQFLVSLSIALHKNELENIAKSEFDVGFIGMAWSSRDGKTRIGLSGQRYSEPIDLVAVDGDDREQILEKAIECKKPDAIKEAMKILGDRNLRLSDKQMEVLEACRPVFDLIKDKQLKKTIEKLYSLN